MRVFRQSVRSGRGFGGLLALAVVVLVLSAGVADAKRKNKSQSRETQRDKILAAAKAEASDDQGLTDSEARAEVDARTKEIDALIAEIRARDAQIKANISAMVGARGTQREELSQANKALGEAEAELTNATIKLQAAAAAFGEARADFKRRYNAANSNAATNSTAPPVTAADLGTLQRKDAELKAALGEFQAARLAVQGATANMENLENQSALRATDAATQQTRTHLRDENARLRAEQMTIARQLLGIRSFGELGRTIQAQLNGPNAPAAPAQATNAGQAANAVAAQQAAATAAQQAAAQQAAAQQAANALQQPNAPQANVGVFNAAPAPTNNYGPAPAVMAQYGQSSFADMQ